MTTSQFELPLDSNGLPYKPHASGCKLMNDPATMEKWVTAYEEWFSEKATEQQRTHAIAADA